MLSFEGGAFFGVFWWERVRFRWFLRFFFILHLLRFGDKLDVGVEMGHGGKYEGRHEHKSGEQEELRHLEIG